jgi:ABC-type transport system involved in cytochrome c biogenesis permease subunit
MSRKKQRRQNGNSESAVQAAADRTDAPVPPADSETAVQAPKDLPVSSIAGSESAVQVSPDRKSVPVLQPTDGNGQTNGAATMPDFRAKGPGPVMVIINAVASLKLTVAMFVLSIFLVFAGTLAQVDNGLWTVVDTYFRGWYVWIPFQIFVPRSVDAHWLGGFPFPGGWTLGAILLTNLLAAHVSLTVKLFTIRTSGHQFMLTMLKRSGILILHSGLVVMMVGEFITGKYAVEGQMTIEGGKSSNYLEHQQYTEVSIVDASDPKMDDVVVVPGKMLARSLKRGTPIQNDELPFDIEVKKYFVNSALVNGAPQTNLATAGHGLKAAAVEKPEVSGTDSEQKIDIPAAYITLRKKGGGEVLGTYLVTQWVTPQQVTVGGKSYDIEMRLKRTYKPYTVELLKFTHDVYPGTDKPKDFASEVRLVDPTENENFETRIWMNHPLRYNGETFFQQSFLPGDTGTILQVVRNPGWLLPYISCVIVALGMIVHFGIKLVTFLVVTVGTNPITVGPLVRYLPIAVLPLGLILLVAIGSPHREPESELQVQAFARLPVQEGGRIKPIDTLARNSLMGIAERTTFTDKDGKTQAAIRWLLDAVTKNPAAEENEVFRITNDQVLSYIGLQRKPGFRYSIKELRDAKGMEQFIRRARELEGVDPKHLSELDRNIQEFAKHLQLYLNIADLRGLAVIPPADGGSTPWRSVTDVLHDQQATPGETKAANAYLDMLVAYRGGDAKKFNSKLGEYQEYVEVTLPTDTVHTSNFEAFFNHLQPFYICTVLYVVIVVLACVSFLLSCLAGQTDLVKVFGLMIYGIVCFATLLSFVGTVLGGIWADQSWGRFWGWDPKENGALMIVIWNALVLHARWAGLVKTRGMVLLTIGGNVITAWSWFGVNMLGVGLHSYGFMSGALFWLLFFISSQVGMIGVGLVPLPRATGFGAWKGLATWAQVLRRVAFWLMALALLIHFWGLIARMTIQDRPFVMVTNLYSSAVFIGLGCVALGLVLELIFRNGIGAMVGSVLGFVTAIIAHNLAAGGDTLEMMQAVLDTNLWLATHVTCVTMGYTATFVAGVLGLVFVIVSVLYFFVSAIRRWLSGELFKDRSFAGVVIKAIGLVTYGIVCFATMISFNYMMLGVFIMVSLAYFLIGAVARWVLGDSVSLPSGRMRPVTANGDALPAESRGSEPPD